MKTKLYPLDTVSSDPCPKCGGKGWIIDGETLDGPYWLLCLASNDPNCVETKPVPDDIEVVRD